MKFKRIKILFLLLVILSFTGCNQPTTDEAGTTDTQTTQTETIAVNVNAKIEELLIAANGGDTYAAYSLYRLARDYNSIDALKAISVMDATKLAIHAESGDMIAYDRLLSLREFSENRNLDNDSFDASIRDISVDAFVTNAENGEIEAFSFLLNIYEDHNTELYDALNQMNIQTLVSLLEEDSERFITYFDAIVTYGLLYDNHEAITVINDYIDNANDVAMHIIFNFIVLNEYDNETVINSLLERVDVSQLLLNESLDDQQFSTSALFSLSYLGNSDALDALIDRASQDNRAYIKLTELLASDYASEAFLGIQEVASENPNMFGDYFAEVFEHEAYKQVATTLLVDLIESGCLPALNSYRGLIENPDFEAIEVDQLVQNIQNFEDDVYDDSLEILLYLETFQKTDNARDGLAQLAVSGNPYILYYLTRENGYQQLEKGHMDALMNYVTPESNKEYIDFVFGLVIDGFMSTEFDFDTTYLPLDDTQKLLLYTTFFDNIDGIERYYLLKYAGCPTEGPILQALVDRFNQGDLYAYKYLNYHASLFLEDNSNAIDLNNYGISFDTVISLIEAGDYELLNAVSYSLLHDHIFPDNELATLNVSGYYNMIVTEDVRCLDFIVDLAQNYTNPYAMTVMTEVENGGILPVMSQALYLSSGMHPLFEYYQSLYDFTDTIEILEGIFDQASVTDVINTMDMTVLLNRVNAGDLDANNILEYLIEYYDNTELNNALETLDITTMINQFESGNFEAYEILVKFATIYNNTQALNALTTVELTAPSTFYFRSNTEMIIDTLYDLVINYDNENALSLLFDYYSQENDEAEDKIEEMIGLDYTFNFAEDLLSFLLEETNTSFIRYHDVIISDMIINGNQLALDIVMELVKIATYDNQTAVSILEVVVYQGYQPAIDLTIESAEASYLYAFAVLQRQNMTTEINQLDLSYFMNSVESADENWMDAIGWLYYFANDYQNQSILDNIQTIDLTNAFFADLDEVYFEGCETFVWFLEQGNYTYLESAFTLAEAGNLDMIHYLSPTLASTEYQERYFDILEAFEPYDIYHVNSHLISLIENSNQTAFDMAIEMIENGNDDLYYEFINLSYQLVVDYVTPLIEVNDYKTILLVLESEQFNLYSDIFDELGYFD